MVQKMLVLCATKNGTKTDELLQSGERGHERIWKEGLLERKKEDGGTSSRLEFSWLRNGNGLLPRKNVGRQRSLTEKKTEINCWNIVLCMKKTFSAVDCERTWKVKKVEVEKLNEEARKEVRVGKAK